jgi:hypothetical protein
MRCQKCGDYEPQYLCNAQNLSRITQDSRFMLCQECLESLFKPPPVIERRWYFFCEEGTRLSKVLFTEESGEPTGNYYPVLYAAMSREGPLHKELGHIPVFADMSTLRKWWLKRGVITGAVVALDPELLPEYEEAQFYYFHKDVT